MLVLITAYYAWATRQMVTEMRAAARYAQLPHIVADLWFLTPTYAYASIQNVGAGTAIDVNVVVTWEGKPDGDMSDHAVPWRGVIAPGGQHVLSPPPMFMDRDSLIDEVAANYGRLHIAGSMVDSLGNRIEIDTEVADLAGYWDALKGAGERVRNRTANLESVINTLEKIEKAILKR